MHKLIGLCVVSVLAITAPAIAGERRDNEGNLWITDEATEGTPGAGAGLGAVVKPVSATLMAFENHRFDLRLGLTAIGSSSDGEGEDESVISGVTLFYRPGEVGWLRIGPRLEWDAIDRGKISLGIPASLKLFPDPWSETIWWLNLDVLPEFVVRTTEVPDGVERESAVTWAPGAGLAVEIPMNLFSVEVGAGAAFPFSIEGVTDQDANEQVEQLALGGTVAVNFRLGR